MRALLLSAVCAAVSLPMWAADEVKVDEIIRKFAAKEAEFAQARSNYTYRQTVKMEELDPSGNPSGGKWEEIADIIFSPEGRRMERVVWAPVVNLRNIQLTPDDVADLRSVQPFVLTTNEIPDYDINYLGKEKVETKEGLFNCIKFSPLLIEGTIFKGGEQMMVWVTDDANKIPVRVESPIIVGAVRAELHKYQGLKNPVTSKVK